MRVLILVWEGLRFEFEAHWPGDSVVGWVSSQVWRRQALEVGAGKLRRPRRCRCRCVCLVVCLFFLCASFF